MEELLIPLEEEQDAATTIAYANDVMTIVQGNPKLATETNTNSIMRLLTMWCNKIKLEISAEKYSLM